MAPVFALQLVEVCDWLLSLLMNLVEEGRERTSDQFMSGVQCNENIALRAGWVLAVCGST